MQSFLYRLEGYKFSNQGVILHVLDLSVDLVTWELNLRSFSCYKLTGCRCCFGSRISVCIVYRYIRSCSRIFLGLLRAILCVHLNVFNIIGGRRRTLPVGGVHCLRAIPCRLLFSVLLENDDRVSWFVQVCCCMSDPNPKPPCLPVRLPETHYCFPNKIINTLLA